MAQKHQIGSLELGGASSGFGGENEPLTPNSYFQTRFPAQTEQYGPAFLELRETILLNKTKVTPISLNIDFFASIFSDPLLGLEVVYFEPDMQFYYSSPFDPVFKPVSQEKLQNLYRGFLIQCAKAVNYDVNILNLFYEFRSDKMTKHVTNGAKSILAADSSFFSAESKHERIRGVELFERVARKFVDEMLSAEPGQILKLADAYTVFRGLLKASDLPEIKRSDFKAVVAPLIRDQFNVALRNDLGGSDGGGLRGWKNVRLIQSGPGLN